MIYRIFLALALIFSFCGVSNAGTTTIDNAFVQNDVFSSDFHSRLNSNFTTIITDGVNNIESANVADDSLAEVDMADDINPRIRTYEGASCEFVYSGLLPATDADLSSDISAGTAYPRGYRITKGSATSHTYSASVWTYVDIDQNGDFQYSEVAIDASAPSVASNSIRLARVSTDATTINDVQDLRTTSCASGPFEDIADATGEATLEDVLAKGQPVRRFSPAGRTPDGIARGLFVSYDTHTTFSVTSGVAYINGKYRYISTDVTVPQTNDNPATGVHGLDSGAIANSTRYYVYAVADQDNDTDLSVSYSTNATTPAGTTNSRLIGSIVTDATSLFTSADVVTAHAISEREIAGGWISFNGTGTIAINDSYNVSSITDNGGTGNYTVTWDQDFNNTNYAWAGAAKNASGNSFTVVAQGNADTKSATALQIRTLLDADTAHDPSEVTVIAMGDTRQ